MLTIGGGCVKTHEWHAPKGQKHIAQGSALGKRNPHATYALYGKKPNYYGVALTGRTTQNIHSIPRALPWAM